MISNEQELRAAFDLSWSTGQSGLRVWPGPDEDLDPEGCIVVDGRGEGWRVYRSSRGPKDVRTFEGQEEAFDFAYRRWVLWDEDA